MFGGLGKLLGNLPGMQLLQNSPLGKLLGGGGGGGGGGGAPPLSEDAFKPPNPMEAIMKKMMGG